MKEFRDTLHGHSDEWLSFWFGVDQKTIRRWKSGDAIPKKYAEIFAATTLDGELGAAFGKDWDGFTIGRDKQLYIPGFRGGFSPHELRGFFFRMQLVAHLESQNRHLAEQIEALETELQGAYENATKLRKLISLESRYGLMLERITE